MTETNKRTVGCLVLVLLVLLVLLTVALSMFVGLRFGAEWGWATIAVAIAFLCVVVVRTVHDLMWGRSDG